MLLIISFMVAMLISVVMVPGLMRVALPLGLVDEPNERKVHQSSIPRIGGIAIAAGSLIPIFCWVELSSEVIAYLIGAVVIVIFGIWDDRSELGYRTKLFGQILAITLFIYLSRTTIQWLPFQGLSIAPLWLSVFLTFIALLGITNAVNLTDGLDGLAGGTSLLSLCGIASLAMISGATDLAILCLAICGAIFGFLRFNTHPARIFMGDTGSQFLGFSVGVAAVLLTQKENTALSPMLPLILLGLPILDTLTVMVRRTLAGRSPFSPDKNHFHHRLMHMNFKHYEAVIVIYLVQLSLIFLAFVMRYQSDALLLAIFLSFCVGFNTVFHTLETRRWRYSGATFAAGAAYLQALSERKPSARALVRLTTPFLQLSLPVYFLACFWFGRETQALSIALIGTLLAVFLLSYSVKTDLQLWLQRAVWYGTGALAVYSGVTCGFAENLLSKSYIILLAIMVVISLYLSKDEKFSLNPLDIIVLIGSAGLLFINQSLGNTNELGYAFVQIMLLLYAIELSLSHQGLRIIGRWPMLFVLICGVLFAAT